MSRLGETLTSLSSFADIVLIYHMYSRLGLVLNKVDMFVISFILRDEISSIVYR